MSVDINSACVLLFVEQFTLGEGGADLGPAVENHISLSGICQNVQMAKPCLAVGIAHSYGTLRKSSYKLHFLLPHSVSCIQRISGYMLWYSTVESPRVRTQKSISLYWFYSVPSFQQTSGKEVWEQHTVTLQRVSSYSSSIMMSATSFVMPLKVL